MPTVHSFGVDEEFRVQGPFQAHRSRYKLPALQILMLQEYPADCPTAKSRERRGGRGGGGPDESTFRVLMYSTE